MSKTGEYQQDMRINLANNTSGDPKLVSDGSFFFRTLHAKNDVTKVAAWVLLTITKECGAYSMWRLFGAVKLVTPKFDTNLNPETRRDH
jgi:hypothetical protein